MDRRRLKSENTARNIIINVQIIMSVFYILSTCLYILFSLSIDPLILFYSSYINIILELFFFGIIRKEKI